MLCLFNIFTFPHQPHESTGRWRPSLITSMILIMLAPAMILHPIFSQVFSLYIWYFLGTTLFTFCTICYPPSCYVSCHFHFWCLLTSMKSFTLVCSLVLVFYLLLFNITFIELWGQCLNKVFQNFLQNNWLQGWKKEKEIESKRPYPLLYLWLPIDIQWYWSMI